MYSFAYRYHFKHPETYLINFVNGVARIDGDVIYFEYTVKLSGQADGDLKELSIPVNVLDSVVFKKRLFKSKVAINFVHLKDAHTFDGATNNQLNFSVSKTDSLAARDFCSYINRQLSELKIERIS